MAGPVRREVLVLPRLRTGVSLRWLPPGWTLVADDVASAILATPSSPSKLPLPSGDSTRGSEDE